MTLLYHDEGDTPMNRAQLEFVSTPAPMGARHHPVSFFDFAESVYERAHAYNLDVVSEEYVLNKSHMRMFGVLELSSNLGTRDEYSFLLGVRGSHDRSIPREIAVGSRVFVCSNLCFSGDIGTVKTKQTTFIEDRMDAFINSALDKADNRISYMDTLYQDMKNETISKQDGDEFLCNLYRNDTLPAADLGVALHEWVNPTHKEHDKDGDTVWKLFNACTQSVKPRGGRVNMFTVADRTREIHEAIEGDFLNA